MTKEMRNGTSATGLLSRQGHLESLVERKGGDDCADSRISPQSVAVIYFFNSSFVVESTPGTSCTMPTNVATVMVECDVVARDKTASVSIFHL